MKVKEAIKQLQEADPEAVLVRYGDEDNNYHQINSFREASGEKDSNDVEVFRPVSEKTDKSSKLCVASDVWRYRRYREKEKEEKTIPWKNPNTSPGL